VHFRYDEVHVRKQSRLFRLLQSGGLLHLHGELARMRFLIGSLGSHGKLRLPKSEQRADEAPAVRTSSSATVQISDDGDWSAFAARAWHGKAARVLHGSLGHPVS
jgi:hypothetical protein